MALTLLACLVLTTLSSASKVSCPPDTAPARNISAISFAKLPSTYSSATHPQDPIALEQIRNTLALYPLAIDGKNFAALDLVFSQDVVANYSAPLNVLTPLSTVQSILQKSLAVTQTQHKLSTQVIEIMPHGCQAMSLTYYEAMHFGQGKYTGQVRVYLGRDSAGAQNETGHLNLIHRTDFFRIWPVSNSMTIPFQQDRVVEFARYYISKLFGKYVRACLCSKHLANSLMIDIRTIGSNKRMINGK